MAIELTEKVFADLAEIAAKARENAYCPYSGFAVGAALLDANGKVWTGVNIENAAYGPTNCAERTAFFKAVSEGVREFAAIAISGGKTGEEPDAPCAPCGICRQVMREFCADEFKIILGRGEQMKVYTLTQLLPESFSPRNLE